MVVLIIRNTERYRSFIQGLLDNSMNGDRRLGLAVRHLPSEAAHWKLGSPHLTLQLARNRSGQQLCDSIQKTISPAHASAT